MTIKIHPGTDRIEIIYGKKRKIPTFKEIENIFRSLELGDRQWKTYKITIKEA